MVRTKCMPPAVAEVENYLNGVAKSLVDRLFGPNGPPWGTRLTELEDTVLAIRQHLSEQMLELALQRQADTVAERPLTYRPCPSCGGAVVLKHPVAHTESTESGTGAAAELPPSAPRRLETRGGDAHWDEPAFYCHTCRRSFSPSIQKSGH